MRANEKKMNTTPKKIKEPKIKSSGKANQSQRTAKNKARHIKMNQLQGDKLAGETHFIPSGLPRKEKTALTRFPLYQIQGI